MIKHEYKHRVTYADTDAMGVMYYANYLRVYEAARGEFMRSIDFSFSEMEEKNIVCPAVNVNMKYLRSAKFDWEVKVISTIEELPLARLRFIQQMYSPEGDLLNKAVIDLGFVDKESFKVSRCPQWILSLFEKKFEEQK